MPNTLSRLASVVITVLLAGSLGAVLGAGAAPHQQQPGDADQSPETVQDLGPLFEAERNVRRIVATFFKRSQSEVSHRRGWEELRAYAHDDRVYPLLLDLFERQPLDSRNDLLRFFADDTGVHAQTMLAWVAVFEHRSAEHRDFASATLAGLVGENEPDFGAQRVMALGLKSGDDAAVNAAANLIRQYNLLRAVPLLAQAQAQPQNTGGRDGWSGALAQIVVGTQQAFVADLTPVVAAGTVAFQPTVGVVSSGTVLRVIDAVVYEYRTDVHRVLVDMTTAASGEPTGHLGYDANAWRAWYTRELEPKLDAQRESGEGG